MASIDLPLDIIHTILLNLPVKSLLRFKAVCKSWNAIISDRQFTKTHQQRSKNSRSQNLFLCIRKKPQKICLFKFENKDWQVKAIPQQPSGKVVCFGDGLVLLSNALSRKKVFTLWNPSSRKRTKFRCPYVCYDDEADFGLCHDPHLDDYKVVVRYGSYYFVYSCRNKLWTNKQEFQYKNQLYLYPNEGVLVDGFSFWISEDENYIAKDIIYFDPRDDKFKKLRTPGLLEGDGTFYLTSLRGCLCLYENKRIEYFTTLRIWMMEGHVDLCSWSKLLNVDIEPALDEVHLVWPMLFSEDNELVISVDHSGHQIRLNPKENAFKTVLITGHGIYDESPMVRWQDSLFFPIQDSVRPKRKRSSSRKMNVSNIK